MGRGTLSLNLIPNLKSRRSTFKKRKDSLMKKAYELSTLCDVRTCVLVHGPASAPHEDRLQPDVEVHSWPPNCSDIEAMVCAYKNNNCFHKRMCFNLYDFFSDRRRKIETEMRKIRENVEEVMYPKLDERLEHLSEDELREFMDGLDSKIEAASGMIDFMEADFDNLFGEEASTEFSSKDDQNVLQMGGDLGPPVMPPLVDLEFSDLLIGPNGDQIEYSFENLQLLLQEDEDNNT